MEADTENGSPSYKKRKVGMKGPNHGHRRYFGKKKRKTKNVPAPESNIVNSNNDVFKPGETVAFRGQDALCLGFVKVKEKEDNYSISNFRNENCIIQTGSIYKLTAVSVGEHYPSAGETVLILIQIRKDPKGEDRRIRATIKKVSKKDSNTFNDLHQNIRNLTDESVRLKKLLEEKIILLHELMEQLGDDHMVDGMEQRSPMHKSVMALKTTNNSSPGHNYKMSQGSLYPEDTDSMFSSSSVTNLWPVDSSSPHRLYMASRERTSSIITENIEMSEIGKKPSSFTNRPSEKESAKRCSRVYFELDTSDEEAVMENTPLKDRAIAMISSSTRTPSYTGLKYLADPNLRETAILQDSDTCSYHSLPDGHQGRPYNFGPIPTVCTTLVEDEDQDMSPSTPTLTESDTTVSMRSPDASQGTFEESQLEEHSTPVRELQPLLGYTEAERDDNANVTLHSNVCNDDVDELLITSIPVNNRNNNRRTKQQRLNITCDIIEYI